MVLLLLVVLSVAAASYALDRLDGPGAGHRSRAEQTGRALAEARSALLGWAATYPDQHPTGPGPGYLPCPDVDDDGSPDTACPRGAFGRLPWRHLGLPDVRDGSGERLWYGLADDFRNNPVKVVPMNSETPGGLSLDGEPGVVAVLLAPGASLAGQDRARARNLAASFLEGDNARPADGAFASAGAGAFNDRVLAIRRAELMAAVEARVLAEVARALGAYRAAAWNPDGVYPWSSPWAEPRTAAGFSGRAGTAAGHLPVHRPGGAFGTAFSLRWSGIRGGRVEARGSVVAADLRAGAVDVPLAGGRCVWTSVTAVDCAGTASVPVGGGATREYAVEVRLDRPTAVDVRPPAPGAPRRRGLRFAGALSPRGRFAVTIIERLRLPGESSRAVVTGAGRLRSAPGTTGRIRVNGIHYDLGVPGELPAWLIDNRWHHLLYVAVSASRLPGGACGPGVACPCVPGAGCVVLHREGSAPWEVPALVVAAGGRLPGQDRAAGRLADYFEGRNRQPLDGRFERRARSGVFNDRVRVVGGGAP